MDHAAFFASVRSSLFGGSLTQQQVEGMEALLDAWSVYGDGDANKLAYVLATPFHETGAKMAPVIENLNYSAAGLRSTFSKYFTAAQASAYAHQPERIANRAYANRMGNGSEASGDGWKFRGRSFPQLTGKTNYADWGKRLGLDLVGNPDLIMPIAIGARVLVQGMMLGTFTGKKLGDYIGGSKVDFTNARRVINGTDKAALIAGYAQKFATAIRAAVVAKPSEPEAPAPVTVGGSLVASLIAKAGELDGRIASAAAELDAIREAQAALQSDVKALG